MKKNYQVIAAACACIAMISLCISNCSKTALQPSPQKYYSYAIGFNLGKTLFHEGLTLHDIDSKYIALGIEDSLKNKEQRFSDNDIKKAFSILKKLAEERKARISAKNYEDSKRFLQENMKRKGVIITKSGLQYEILKKGNGKSSPKLHDIVTVHYEGKLPDGTIFDSSKKGGNTPVDIAVNRVIKGLIEALQFMHVGDKIKVYIPSELGFGDNSQITSIPNNSVLIFTIELLNIKSQKH